MKKHLPNSLTLLNLFFGCLGIVACSKHEYNLVALFIGLALLADFLDGFAARALQVKSELGGQLDSLADMATFGVLPGMMLFSIITTKSNLMGIGAAVHQSYSFSENYVGFAGFAYTLFACLRLAKFNSDTRQTENFIGLATPAGAIFVLGFYMQYFLIWQHESNWDYVIYSHLAAIIVPFILAFLMIAEIEFFSLKGNPFSWKTNKFRVLFLGCAIPQIIFLKWLSFSSIIVSYIIFALLHNTFDKKTETSS
ncbi:MAG: CDP-alcohol phosphatidyltransferase family protein [Sphingobacteriales bacterium]|jgi:CDP-diacylglycerol--serine O-phosphatidyltransferase|nr:CDP-alcohol phosphatidyltransferase family protein [Sphingobacteriales bacterium]